MGSACVRVRARALYVCACVVCVCVSVRAQECKSARVQVRNLPVLALHACAKVLMMS